jgi:hypothetical protein
VVFFTAVALLVALALTSGCAQGRERGIASSQMQKLSAHKEEAARMERPFFA